jgi:hypothetical protein
MPSIARSNWEVEYYWSPSSGLKLGRCDYQSIRVVHDASVPFIYVNYAGDAFGPFTDELRSVSQRVEVRDIVHGFDLKVTYDYYGPDYQYDHVWRFHHDGQFGPRIVVHGPGEEIEGKHVYHVPFRFDIDVSGASADSFHRRLASGRWTGSAREGGYLAADTSGTRFEWRVVDETSGKRVLVRPGVGDEAELWALQYKDVESWSSWGGVGAAAPGSPGSVPAVYDDNQPLQNTDIVLWYLARVPSHTAVTACGPWFELRGFPEPQEEDEDEHRHEKDDGHDHDDEGGHH